MNREELKTALKPHVADCVVRHATADIELASGRMSDFYFDGRQVTLSGVAVRLVGQLIADIANELGATAVGGPTIGADPMVGATLACAAETGTDLKGFLIRKEPKARGMKKQVEGPSLDGAKALLIEDTVTSGGSLIRAAEALRREWPTCEIIGALVLVDREEGAIEKLKSAELETRSVYLRTDFKAE